MVKKHKLLERLFEEKVGFNSAIASAVPNPRVEEVTSFENMKTVVFIGTICVLLFSALEVATYFLYLNKVISLVG